MTEKQTKTLQYAGFTEAQIAALASVFPAFPAPERRKEIDGFVREAVENMHAINEGMERKSSAAIRKVSEVLKARIRRKDNQNPDNQ